MEPLTVLVIEHEEAAPAAWLGDWLVEAGCSLSVCRPYAGDPLPTDLTAYDGLLVLGGAMDAWDDAGYPWLVDTRGLVRAAEESGTPTLGLCLGHQVAALALGGDVGRNPAGPAIGVLPVGWSAEVGDDPLLVALAGARHAVHWNNDVALGLPEGAVVLAVTADGAVQAARLGRHVWGLQCHPEAGPDVLGRWVRDEEEELRAQGVDVAGLLTRTGELADELRTDWAALGTAFAGLLRSAREARGVEGRS